MRLYIHEYSRPEGQDGEAGGLLLCRYDIGGKLQTAYLSLTNRCSVVYIENYRLQGMQPPGTNHQGKTENSKEGKCVISVISTIIAIIAISAIIVISVISVVRTIPSTLT